MQFPTLVRAMKIDDSTWSNWAKNPRCELDFPPQFSKNAFHKLMVLQALRPDRLQSAIKVYVCEAVGVSSVSPPPMNFQALVNETGPATPVLFVTTAGADPTQELEEFAIKSVGKNAFTQLALGSGQTELALSMLEQAARDGTWLCLKNLHLVTPFLVDLEKALKTASATAKPSFRLWLTTEPHANFPPILLQQSLKITYESPPGIQQNLLRTYEAWDEAYINKGSVTRAQLLFVLAWFHAVMQERRTYIPQGFTKFYEFSFADCRSGADIIDAFCAKITKGQKVDAILPEVIPWASIWGLMKFAIYGGRIDNDHDMRVLVTYLGLFFHQDVLSSSGYGTLLYTTIISRS
jgi:dynein heavy chain 2